MAEDRKKRGDLGKEKKPKSKKKSTKKSNKRVKDMILHRADSGELLATHRHHPKPTGEPEIDEEHVVPDGGVQDHVDTHLPPPGSEAVGAPSPQPGSMMGGM